jgi:hypothetical protein
MELLDENGVAFYSISEEPPSQKHPILETSKHCLEMASVDKLK